MDKLPAHAAPQPSVEVRLALRQRAESRFAGLPESPTAAQLAQMPLAMRHLLHELQVHQIELEMQNEELRRAQTTLDTERAHYFDFYDLAPVGYCTLDAQGLIGQVNLTTARLMGVTRDRLVARPLSQFIVAEDHDVFYLFRQRLLESGQTVSCELRIKRIDGSFVWVSLAALAVPADDGSTALRLVLGDITERKQAEEKLQLAASVFSQTGEGIIVTDLRGNIVEVNDAFTRITGYSRAEVLGRNPRLLSSGRQAPAVYLALWAELTETGHWSGELWNRRKNGEVYAELLSVSAVRDTQGVVQRYVAMFSDISQSKSHQAQLEHMAYYDVLTGLPNRVLKADRLQQAMALTRRSGKLLAVVYIDLDGFKSINDHYGHAAGDQMLIAVAKHMQAAMREGDTLARVGGDEFAAVLLDLENTEACLPLLERLLDSVALPLHLPEYTLQVSASLGVSFYPQAQEIEADQLLRQADQAMYQAKLSGKDRYQVFDTAQDISLRSWHEDLSHIHQALGNHEFVLYYQPKVNMRTGQVMGVEALIRWQHPAQGLLAPAAFLPVIENHPLAIEVGEWVMDAALTQMELWQAQGVALPVSVNVGALQLQQPDFLARLKALLARHPLVNPAHLELEILETSALQDVVYVSGLIEACRQLGVTFALDDFGTGYSSLIYLKRLRVALLKIDQGFVRDMLHDPDDQAILQGIVGLAGAFHCAVIAEGVETVAHGRLLLQLGCELAQGFGIAKPMPAADLPAWAAGWQPDAAWREA
ncbi:MAG: EAL domain-containing protein [Rhodoferax sp.]|uniref:putative bifunctional diguanylate cyclase/phosphodiesterase n=1 Tax=Rhodoferax sp. TaxID=50421 RepID=UPI0026389D4A|nr:EAL domain-containing protein [Rhodoferax sp.]MDD2881029.1 EAL domain-containing protein [Rhodoferax sp.]